MGGPVWIVLFCFVGVLSSHLLVSSRFSGQTGRGLKSATARGHILGGELHQDFHCSSWCPLCGGGGGKWGGWEDSVAVSGVCGFPHHPGWSVRRVGQPRAGWVLGGVGRAGVLMWPGVRPLRGRVVITAVPIFRLSGRPAHASASSCSSAFVPSAENSARIFTAARGAPRF